MRLAVNIALICLAVTSPAFSVETVSSGIVSCEWKEKPYFASFVDHMEAFFYRGDVLMLPSKSVSFGFVNTSTGSVAAIMTVKAPSPTDSVIYKCYLMYNKTERSLERFEPLQYRPIPAAAIKNSNVPVGNQYLFSCIFGSAVNYKVTNYTLVANDKVWNLVESAPEGVVVDLNLKQVKIAAVRNEHRGNYSCTAVNEYGSETVSAKLRVKSPYAAIWPAVGIFLEVLILVIVVFVYERQRAAKKEADASGNNDSEQDVHTNSNDKSKNASDLRSRGTKA